MAAALRRLLSNYWFLRGVIGARPQKHKMAGRKVAGVKLHGVALWVSKAPGSARPRSVGLLAEALYRAMAACLHEEMDLVLEAGIVMGGEQGGIIGAG